MSELTSGWARLPKKRSPISKNKNPQYRTRENKMYQQLQEDYLNDEMQQYKMLLRDLRMKLEFDPDNKEFNAQLLMIQGAMKAIRNKKLDVESQDFKGSFVY
jgi:hypothetical protein